MSAPPLPKYRVDESNTISVLLVSPNSRLRLQLREKLRQPRWNLTEAASGAEALEFCTNFSARFFCWTHSSQTLSQANSAPWFGNSSPVCRFSP